MLTVTSAVAVSVQKSTYNRLHAFSAELESEHKYSVIVYIDDVLLKIINFVLRLRLSFFATAGEILDKEIL